MEKNKNKINLKKIFFVCLSLLLIVSALAVSVFASDTFSVDVRVTNPDFLIEKAVVNNPRDYGVNSNVQFLLDNYNSIGLNTTVSSFQNVKYTGYINYPFDDVSDGYDGNGRLWASFLNIYGQNGILFSAPHSTQKNIVTYACVQPDVSMSVPSQTQYRCTLGGRSLDLYFADVDYIRDKTKPTLESVFGFSPVIVCQPTVSQNYNYLKATISFTVVYDNGLDDNNALFVKEHSYTEYIPYTVSDVGELSYMTAIHKIAVNNDLLRRAGVGTNDCVVTDLHINYDYLTNNSGGSAGTYNYRVIQAVTQSTCNSGEEFINVSELNNYEDNSLANLLTKLKIYIVESIEDISFTDWLENAIGGFLDFEFIPNITLGTMLLVTISFGIVFFIIRMWRG